VDWHPIKRNAIRRVHILVFSPSLAELVSGNVFNLPGVIVTVHNAMDIGRSPIRYTQPMTYAIEFEQEDDGRWIAEIPALPGVMSYGASKREAESKVEAMALRVIADSLERESLTTSEIGFAVA
jgi:predicted RNase H-like HicB family nuclease